MDAGLVLWNCMKSTDKKKREQSLICKENALNSREISDQQVLDLETTDKRGYFLQHLGQLVIEKT